MAPYFALGCMVAAGVALRGEGGTNFSVNGGFARWIMWALIFCALPTVPLLMNTLGVSGLSNNFTGGGTEFSGMTTAAKTFVQTYIVGDLVPSIAGVLVLKAVLDAGEGKSPLPSLVSAIFVLSANGLYTLAAGWVGTDAYGVTTGLKGALAYVGGTVCPISAAFCCIGAVVHQRRQMGASCLDWAGSALIYRHLGLGSIMGSSNEFTNQFFDEFNIVTLALKIAGSCMALVALVGTAASFLNFRYALDGLRLAIAIAFLYGGLTILGTAAERVWTTILRFASDRQIRYPRTVTGLSVVLILLLVRFFLMEAVKLRDGRIVTSAMAGVLLLVGAGLVVGKWLSIGWHVARSLFHKGSLSGDEIK